MIIEALIKHLIEFAEKYDNHLIGYNTNSYKPKFLVSKNKLFLSWSDNKLNMYIHTYTELELGNPNIISILENAIINDKNDI